MKTGFFRGSEVRGKKNPRRRSKIQSKVRRSEISETAQSGGKRVRYSEIRSKTMLEAKKLDRTGLGKAVSQVPQI